MEEGVDRSSVLADLSVKLAKLFRSRDQAVKWENNFDALINDTSESIISP